MVDGPKSTYSTINNSLKLESPLNRTSCLVLRESSLEGYHFTIHRMFQWILQICFNDSTNAKWPFNLFNIQPSNTVYWDILVSWYFHHFGSDGYSFILASLILILLRGEYSRELRIILCIRVVFLSMNWITVNLSKTLKTYLRLY